MPEHAQDWLGAYLDGELQGRELAWVQKHLETCPGCQASLEELRSLSALLRAAPPLVASSRFAANLSLNLPRQTRAAQAPGWFQRFGWLAALGLMGVWLFIEVTFFISTPLNLAAQWGLFGETGSQPSQTLWFALATQFPIEGLEPVLVFLNDAQVQLQNLLGRALLQLIPLLLSLGCLTLWLRRQNSNTTGANHSGILEGV